MNQGKKKIEWNKKLEREARLMAARVRRGIIRHQPKKK